jgi:hypothetical protein
MIAKERGEFHPDFGEVPQSKGIPTALLVSVIIGVIMIFAIGGGVVLTAGHGHGWPASSTLRQPLGSATP